MKKTPLQVPGQISWPSCLPFSFSYAPRNAKAAASARRLFAFRASSKGLRFITAIMASRAAASSPSKAAAGAAEGAAASTSWRIHRHVSFNQNPGETRRSPGAFSSTALETSWNPPFGAPPESCPKAPHIAYLGKDGPIACSCLGKTINKHVAPTNPPHLELCLLLLWRPRHLPHHRGPGPGVFVLLAVGRWVAGRWVWGVFSGRGKAPKTGPDPPPPGLGNNH